MPTERPFPIQREYVRGAGPMVYVGPKSIPWADAERAYTTYFRMYGGQQSLERLAERGGFGWIEYLALRDTAEKFDVNKTDSRTLYDCLNASLKCFKDEVNRAAQQETP